MEPLSNQPLRVVIFTSVPPHRLDHFLRRLRADAPEVSVVGVLYEMERPPLAREKRIKRFRKLVRDPLFLRYAASKATGSAAGKLAATLDRLLRWFHAAPEHPGGPALSLQELQDDCCRRGIAFRTTRDLHDAESLEFVRRLQPELGVIFGTRILKPKLFGIPARGSINIHKHKVPEYRGGGAPGLWELRDGRDEQWVTVHRARKEVDAGAVLGERGFPIHTYDTLESVGLKADLTSIDLLIDVLRAEARNESEETPQTEEGTVYKGFQPHQVWQIEREIAKKRTRFRPRNNRPLLKLLVRALAYPALRTRNRRHAQEKSFPLVILFHHLISDRPKFMATSTSEFARHVCYLKRHYQILSLPEAVAAGERGGLDRPTVVLTFDDGYEENFLALRAVAEAENIPVTLFICTENITKQAPFDHDLDRGETGFPAMSWDQVRQMAKHGVTVGSHTRTHFDCGSEDVERLEYEILGAKEDLRRELGEDVEHFSFPKGYPKNMSAPAVQMALGAYSHVYSAYGGHVRGPVKRGGVIVRSAYPGTLLELELTLQGILERGPSPEYYQD